MAVRKRLDSAAARVAGLALAALVAGAAAFAAGGAFDPIVEEESPATTAPGPAGHGMAP